MADVPTTPLVLNEAVATANGYAEQSDIDQYDWFILQMGLAGWGVISGCQVTAQVSPDMTVAVSEGLIQAGSQQVHVAGGNSAAFSASGANTKYAFVEINPTLAPASQIVRNAGTAAANPIFPAPTVGNIVLAAITIPTSSTSIATAQIVDKRALINNAFSTSGKLYLDSFNSIRSRP